MLGHELDRARPLASRFSALLRDEVGEQPATSGCSGAGELVARRHIGARWRCDRLPPAGRRRWTTADWNRDRELRTRRAVPARKPAGKPCLSPEARAPAKEVPSCRRPAAPPPVETAAPSGASAAERPDSLSQDPPRGEPAYGRGRSAAHGRLGIGAQASPPPLRASPARGGRIHPACQVRGASSRRASSPASPARSDRSWCGYVAAVHDCSPSAKWAFKVSTARKMRVLTAPTEIPSVWAISA